MKKYQVGSVSVLASNLPCVNLDPIPGNCLIAIVPQGRRLELPTTGPKYLSVHTVEMVGGSLDAAVRAALDLANTQRGVTAVTIFDGSWGLFDEELLPLGSIGFRLLTGIQGFCDAPRARLRSIKELYLPMGNHRAALDNIQTALARRESSAPSSRRSRSSRTLSW